MLKKILFCLFYLNMCIFFFLIECNFFYKKKDRWNVFDFLIFLIVFKVINIVVWMVRVVVLFVMGLIGFYYKIFKYYENLIMKIIMLDIVDKVWDLKI